MKKEILAIIALLALSGCSPQGTEPQPQARMERHYGNLV